MTAVKTTASADIQKTAKYEALAWFTRISSAS